MGAQKKEKFLDFLYFNKSLILSVLLTVPIIIFDLIYNFIDDCFIASNTGAFIGADAAIAGFLLTSLGIFYAIPFSERIQERIKKVRYNIVIPRTFFTGITVFLINILVYLIVSKEIILRLNTYLFIVGVLITFFSARVLYVLGVKRDK